MGAGASTLPLNVKQDLVAEFTKKRSDIDAKIAAGANDADIAKFLTAFRADMLNIALKSAQTPPRGKIVHKPVQSGMAKGSVKSGKSMKRGTRRRSYGVQEQMKLGRVSEDKSMVESASAPVIEPVMDSVAAIEVAQAEMAAEMERMNAEIKSPGSNTQEKIDSWDSVTLMPYCDDCQMAFKTQAALTRHVKYSNLHEQIVKRKTEEEAAAAVAESSEKKIDIRQEEGKDFRLLYYGSKFFWRTQDNIDLSFYQHIVLHVIEVVPFDVYKNKQMDRLYFDKFIVESAIDSDVRKKVEERRSIILERKKNNKFGDGDEFNFDEEYVAIQRMELTTFLLSRLQLHHITQEGQGNKPKSKIVFAPLSNDDSGGGSPLLEEAPALLIPVSVTHRRNTSNAEVKKKLHEVHTSQADLKQAISKAEKITQHVHNFISIRASLQKYKNMPLPRKRFVMAANKIILMNMVEKTKKHLANLDAAKQGKNPTGRSKRESIRLRKEL